MKNTENQGFENNPKIAKKEEFEKFFNEVMGDNNSNGDNSDNPEYMQEMKQEIDEIYKENQLTIKIAVVSLTLLFVGYIFLNVLQYLK